MKTWTKYEIHGRTMAALPQPMASVIYRAAVYAVGEGNLFKRLRQLHRMQWDSADRLLSYQESKLGAILKHARLTSSFYEARIPEMVLSQGASAMLLDVPLLEKRDLQQHADDIRSGRPSGRVSRKTTGGSTGEPVTILKDRTATAYERAAMWLAYGWFGVEMGDPAARFWGIPYTWERRVASHVGDLCMNRVRFSAFEFDENKLGDYWRQLGQFNPTYVHGYVSMLEQMARWALREGVPTSLELKSIVATSEVLTDPQRTAIEKAFGAPVQVEYGCGEVGPIAHECPEGSLHIMAPNLWVEVLRQDGTPASPGESGEIVLTDLHNKAMPLIRYRVGDSGIVGGPCSCGRGLPVLEKVWGRAYDFVELPDGRHYHGEFFMYVFEDLRSSGTPIGQFQVIQTQDDRLTVLLTSDESIAPSTRNAIVETLGRRLPGVEVTVEQVPEIPRTRSGKMQVIKRQRQEDGQAT